MGQARELHAHNAECALEPDLRRRSWKGRACGCGASDAEGLFPSCMRSGFRDFPPLLSRHELVSARCARQILAQSETPHRARAAFAEIPGFSASAHLCELL